MKTIQDLIDAREPLDNFYEERLIALLTNMCRKELKARIKNVVKYHFYSTFDGKWFSKRIYLAPNSVQYNAGQSFPDEIKQIRKELLGE